MPEMSSIPESLRSFAERYTAAGCSQIPDRVANHYSPSGSLCINHGAPAVGRAEIADAARSFMTAFPDMQVRMDRLIQSTQGIEYHWTLTGTNTGPGGTGHCVEIRGFERWKMGREGFIEESQGQFDESLYLHQLKHGVH